MAKALLEKKQALLEEKLRAHSVRWLAAAHVADAKPTDLLEAPVACPNARSASIHDRCKPVYYQLLP